MKRVLLLNQSYEPISVINWQKAMTMLTLDKVEVIREYEDRKICSRFLVIKMPAVVRLLRAFRRPRKRVKFNKTNVLARDNWRCFGAGTKILMADGSQKNIEDVQINDMVIDAYGSPQKVVNKGNRIATNAVYLKSSRSYEKTLTTLDHPFLTPSLEYVELKYNPDTFVLPRNVEYIVTNRIVDTSSVISDNFMRIKSGRIYWSKRSHENGFPAFLYPNPSLSYVLGLFCAEGSTTFQKYGAQTAFSFNISEKDTLAKDVFEYFDGMGLNPSYKVDKNRSTCVVRVCSKSLSILLHKTCGENCYSKKVPWNLIGTYRKEFVKGVFLGDGCFYNDVRKIALNISSNQLISDITGILWGFGIQPTVQKIERPDGRLSWSLILQGENYSKFYDKVLDEPVDAGTPIYGNASFIFRKLQSIEKIDGDVLVYNIEVENTHSYIANGYSVHNCQYCNQKFPTSELTYDHVVPRFCGGKTVWDNIVTCCKTCNSKKGNRLPQEAGLKLRKQPTRPDWVPIFSITLSRKKIPEIWKDFCYIG